MIGGLFAKHGPTRRNLANHSNHEQEACNQQGGAGLWIRGIDHGQIHSCSHQHKEHRGEQPNNRSDRRLNLVAVLGGAGNQTSGKGAEGRL